MFRLLRPPKVMEGKEEEKDKVEEERSGHSRGPSRFPVDPRPNELWAKRRIINGFQTAHHHHNNLAFFFVSCIFFCRTCLGRAVDIDNERLDLFPQVKEEP